MTATTIRLYGEMGAKFGRVHRAHLDTNTPAEAVRYLCSQFPKAKAYLMGAKDRGVAFAVFRGKENIKKENLTEPVGQDEIRIAPVIMGSKNGGVFSIILGAVLVVVGFLGSTYGQAFGGGVWGPILTKMGIAMIAGGVVQLLTPVPKAPKNRDAPDNAPSYSFNGAVNTQAQGNPVPLLYGRMIVGSAVVSAGINAEDYSPASAGVGGGVVGGGNRKTPYDP
ncbi:hypothetical protein MBSD_n2149 [Mizugakiibacter sediminis]|uniref:Phage tail assembly protein n=1 Tax=Mizugakiibacter sediminis TaxID=1475481 RepID=A0A0K8QPL2_9GAMM|nr:tail assembly protein [Mizugakiibacter sediminis]GAP66834.1 hypothetical protein MBSD_n2149 [Mizugakiibacter sediminis]